MKNSNEENVRKGFNPLRKALDKVMLDAHKRNQTPSVINEDWASVPDGEIPINVKDKTAEIK